jgi:deoxyribose-phosphate aldolase
MSQLTDGTLAAHIQYTLIQMGITQQQVERLCRDCIQYGFNAAMIPGCWVPLARRLLDGSPVKVASAVDFPLGVMSTRGRVAETAALVEAGADELDITINIGWLKSGRRKEFRDDVAAVVRMAQGRAIKVMLELPLLTAEERAWVVQVCMDAGARYLKNASSGAVGIATPEDIRFLRQRVRPGVGVKASGGIHTRAQVEQLLAAGAELIGTSAALAIVGADVTRRQDDPLAPRQEIAY